MAVRLHVARRLAESLPLEVFHRVGLHGDQRVEHLEHHMVKAHRAVEDSQWTVRGFGG